jgi:Fur family transcriptional regulator, ferric uptake regulator
VVCRQCGRGSEVELPDLEQWAESTAHALGYSDVTHTVEIFGTCATCRDAAP